MCVRRASSVRPELVFSLLTNKGTQNKFWECDIWLHKNCRKDIQSWQSLRFSYISVFRSVEWDMQQIFRRWKRSQSFRRKQLGIRTDKKIMLKLIVPKYGVRVWDGSSLYPIMGFFKRITNFQFYKRREISLSAERLSDSKGGWAVWSHLIRYSCVCYCRRIYRKKWPRIVFRSSKMWFFDW